jgi:ATP-dependent DNA helicase RecG
MADLKALIKQGEGISVEFKECRRTLNRDVYETVCAFLNRHGGDLLLGVSDAGVVTGVDPDCVGRIKRDFVTAINNPKKINPACYLSVDEVQIDRKTVLHILVPESSQVHRCSGRIFDRNEDGDLDITDHTRTVAELYHRKQTTYSENKIYPYAGLADLRTDLIAKCRRLAGVWREDHPWADMDDLQLLKSAQIYQTDPETGKSGATLAGILLLGKDSVILSAVPHHRTDLILRKVNLDRYDDRDLVTTNLIESYERIIAFIQKHLPDPFYLEGMDRISIRDAIFREVTSNILIHREYRNAFPAKLIIERGQVRTENSNNPHGFGTLNPATFTPFPKNPVIGSFFREIGRADELGSGMRKMMKYGKAYGGADPEMIEGDIFRIIVKYPDTAIYEKDSAVTGEVTPEVTPEVGKMLTVIQGEMSRTEIQQRLGLTDEKHFREHYQQPAVAMELIEMTIPDKPRSSKQKYRLTNAVLVELFCVYYCE